MSSLVSGEHRADRAALLADAGVRRAVDEALAGELEHVLLEGADQTSWLSIVSEQVRVGGVPVGRRWRRARPTATAGSSRRCSAWRSSRRGGGAARPACHAIGSNDNACVGGSSGPDSVSGIRLARTIVRSIRAAAGVDADHADLPGLTGVDHIGFTVPDLERRTASSSTCSAASTCTRSGPFRHDDSDWMPEHLNVHPRAVMEQLRFFRCGGQAIFEVFEYAAPDQDTDLPRNSDIGGHHVALYVDDLDAAVDYLRGSAASPCSASRPRARARRRAALGLLPRALGHAVRAGDLPRAARPTTGRRAAAADRR